MSDPLSIYRAAELLYRAAELLDAAAWRLIYVILFAVGCHAGAIWYLVDVLRDLKRNRP
jgi:hypothetical protein